MTLYKNLKKARVSMAIIMLLLTLALFTDLYGWLPAESYDTILLVQLIPTLIRFFATFSLIAAFGFLIILVITLCTGRLYCSIFCPLGILQDVINRISRWRSKKSRFFKFKKQGKLWRITFLIIMIGALISGSGWLVSWLDPYSLAGRFFSYLIKPIITLGNNGMAQIIEKTDWHFLRHQNFLIPSLLPSLLTLFITGLIGVLAWKRGRYFCNTICPVGTLLGLLSEFSLYKIRFDTDRCTQCGKCAGICKSECINIKHQQIDYSRCVTCFSCLSVCPESALSLTRSPGQTSNSTTKNSQTRVLQGNRRQFLFTVVTLLAGNRLFANHKNSKTSDKGHLLINEKKYPVTPPGSVSLSRFNNTCTACSLCVSACPTQVLQPALTQYGLSGFMQPHMDYLTSFCNFDCNICGQVCPTGAILPLTTARKHITQMGKAIFVKQNCVVYTDETDCGACSEHCPTKAVHMVPYHQGLVIPEVDKDLCIGCGACEHACPVEAPFKAIYIEGNPVHETAKPPDKKEKPILDNTEDFPF